jgi:peroxiredoxin
MMVTKLKKLLAVSCVLLLAGVALAHCGNCPGDKKACPADCKKACCAKAAEKACSADCTKACCAKDGEKKACSADCKKACCSKDAAACAKSCSKESACSKKQACKKTCCGEGGECCKAAAGPVLGAAAPDFTAKDINGKDVQLSQLKGKIVVLEWTNYDCPFVKPHYTEGVMTTANLATKYKDKDVVWLTINSTHYATAETNKKWAEEKKLPQTVVVDSSGKVGTLYKATNTPQMFIVGKDGKLAYTGAIDNAPRGKTPEGETYVNYVDSALAELTAGKQVSTPKTKPYGCTVKYAKK